MSVLSHIWRSAPEVVQTFPSFSDAPLLGSLLDPARSLKNDLATSSYQTLTGLLRRALATERPKDLLNEDVDRWELALSAQGLLEAARVLEARYHLVVTNVPYLGRGQQNDRLKQYCDLHYSSAKNDLANVFLERCIELSRSKGAGVVQVVMPQYWLFLSSYKMQREELLKSASWNLLARLGPRAFETIGGEVVNVILLTLTNENFQDRSVLHGVDVSDCLTALSKSQSLKNSKVLDAPQKKQLTNPDARISLQALDGGDLLEKYASGLQGVKSGDDARLKRSHWEVADFKRWRFTQSGPLDDSDGCYWSCLDWTRNGDLMARLQGIAAHGKIGVAVSSVSKIQSYPYFGHPFTSELAVILPKLPSNASSIFAFCKTQGYEDAVRKIDQKVAITNATLVKVAFDLAHWSGIARSEYPGGLPRPESNSPTQWTFHGHPKHSTDPLQVAVARLVGHHWPAEKDEKIEISAQARTWVEASRSLSVYADKNGIVCIPPVGRESSASDRLLNLLAAAYGDDWSNDQLGQLLTAADHAGKSLDTWLRDKFFIQHCALFNSRPFVWHVWDGLRDGFAALVNYHRLDYKTLESLIYTYLGDWISRQKRDADNGVDGAQEKLAAAEALKKRLELILAGEAPYDIFVRWKPIDEQPIGWNPDLNDGVRMNIRPFLSVPDVGKRGAGVLRDKPKSLHWEKDRGADPADAPWYELGPAFGGKKGDRINDHHLTLAEKQAARAKKGKA